MPFPRFALRAFPVPCSSLPHPRRLSPSFSSSLMRWDGAQAMADSLVKNSVLVCVFNLSLTGLLFRTSLNECITWLPLPSSQILLPSLLSLSHPPSLPYLSVRSLRMPFSLLSLHPAAALFPPRFPLPLLNLSLSVLPSVESRGECVRAAG
jgi:hypothetical protein